MTRVLVPGMVPGWVPGGPGRRLDDPTTTAAGCGVTTGSDEPMAPNHFAAVAAQYAQFRPVYPEKLFSFLALVAKGRTLAWDCATGTGQAAASVARHFDRVIATDIADELLAQAPSLPNVIWRRADARASGIEAGSVDLVTVGNAMHWFHGPEFADEVRRVLRPGGVIAAWSYAFADIEPAIDAITWHLHDVTVGPFWGEPNLLVDRRYRDLHFPFVAIEPPPIVMTSEWDLPHLEGFLRTWSAVTKYRLQHGEDPVTAVHEALSRAWGDPRRTRLVRWRLNLRIGRV